MNFKSLGIKILMLGALLMMYNTIGIGRTTLIISLIILVEAIVFSIKPENYDRFLKFMNPRLYNVYNEKDADFIRKTRKSNIISCYILSLILGFNSLQQIAFKNDNRNLFDFSDVLIFVVIIVSISFLINRISILIMKKSKTCGENLMWSIVMGFGISFVLISAGIVYLVII